MKKLITICLVSVLVLGFGLLSCTTPGGLSYPAANAVIGQIQPEAVRAHTRFLADDLLEGRGTGTGGYQLAANYVAVHFEALGLEPAGTNGSYFQTVPLRKVDLEPGRSSLTLVKEGQPQTLKYAEDYLLDGWVANNYQDAETSVAAPVVFVGFGITAPEVEYDDYADIDVRGKIAAMLVFSAPSTFPHSLRAYYSDTWVKARNAATRGAVGMLFVRSPEEAKRCPWDRAVRQFKNGSLCWLDQSGAPQSLDGIESEILTRALLSRTGADALFAGATHSLEEVFAAAEAGKRLSFKLPVKARVETVVRQRDMKCSNVTAVLRGTDPMLRDEFVVFTAHLDHLGVGEPVKGDSIYNGAVDNASGVAALLEVARAFASLPQPPRRSVLFLAVTGEEMGLVGAEYFAHYPTVPLKSIVANINIDAAVMNRALLDVVAYGAEHSTLGRVVEQAARQIGLEVIPDPHPEEVFFIRSDQYSFVRKGVPAVWLEGGTETDDPQLDGAAMMKEWLQTIYHSPKDDFSQPMDFEGGAKLAQVNFLIGYQVANETQRPTWNLGDFFGEKFGEARAE